MWKLYRLKWRVSVYIYNMIDEMDGTRIRLEWIPSGYKEVIKSDKTNNIKTDKGKPALYNHKDVFIRHGLKRKKVR